MKIYLTSIFMLCARLIVVAQSQLGLPFVHNYSTRDYNAGILNLHIAQDSRGVIYVANNFGLLEFDGTSWRLHPTGKAGKLRHFTISENNDINIASQGEFGYFRTNNSGKWEYTSISEKIIAPIKLDETWKAYQIGDKKYFCTPKAIYEVQGEKVNTIPTKNKKGLGFYQIKNQLYVHQPALGLSVLYDGKLNFICGDERLLYQYIPSMIEIENEKLLIATNQNGFYILDRNKLEVWNPEHQELLSKSKVNTVIRLTNGNFAVGTQTNGLLIFDWEGRLIKHMTKGLGLNHLTIKSLFEDNQRNLWAGHNNGISCIELGQPFSFIDENIGLPGTGYTGYQDNNLLFLGTNSGIYLKDLSKPLGTENNFEFIDNSEGQVYFISKIDDSYLFGFSKGGYEFSVNKKSLQLIGKEGAWTYKPLKNHENILLTGTYAGLEINEITKNGIKHLWKVKNFDISSRVIEQDHEGTIWMTHSYKGVFKIKLSDDLKSVREVNYYGIKSGFPSHELIKVCKIRGELCFTAADGVYIYNSLADKFIKHPFYQEFFPEDAQLDLIKEDTHGNIYFLSKKDMGVLWKDASNKYHKRTSEFNKIQHLLNDDLKNLTILPNNKVLFGAKSGFIVYDPMYNKGNKNDDFDVLIRDISLTRGKDSTIFYGNNFNNTSETNEVIPKMKYAQNSIKFTYSAAYIDGLQMTEYQYKLEGYDKDWSNWEKKNEKEYTNLDEGVYTFKIKAKTLNGQLSEETHYTFQISPPWYRTNFAYFLYFTFFGAVLLIFGLFVRKKYKKEHKKILHEQKTVLTKKEDELNSIKSESEKKIERLKTEKLEESIRHKNKELATSTMHIINKNEFISLIKHDLTTLVKKSPQDPQSKELEKIMSKIDKNISTDEDWKHFEVYFDEVHGNFSERLKDKYPKLSPQDRRLCAYLRMNMTTKEIAMLLNITVRGAEISRYRLRKKLGLSRETNLAAFILNF